MLETHRERGAAVTIGLKSVDNPLEFGIVVTDEDGRIERFLEKPSWGQVFSDTINTGIYILEPEVLTHIPDDGPYDFSKELFPLLLEMGRPLFGHVFDGYWQDIGNLEQYRQANADALDERVRLNVPGIRLRGNVWIGEGVDLHDLGAVQGPAFIGNYCRILPEATVGPYSVLSANVTLRENAKTTHSVIDSGTHIGRAALIEGAIVGRSCDIRAHVRIGEGVAVGDEVTIGEESVLQPGVRIYPYKEIESGALIHESLIWESRASSRLFDQWGVSGRVDVDLTPETAIRLATALGTALKKGSRVVASRDSSPACRMIKRAVITGLTAAGINVADLRVLPAAVSRHLLKMEGYEAGVHVTTHPTDPEVVRIQFSEPPGIALTAALQKEIEKHFSRGELRRVGFNEVGSITYPARVRESYATDLLDTLDMEAIRARNFRIVVDYGYSAASFVLPLVLGPLGVEAVAAHAFITERDQGGADLPELVEQTKRLVAALGADLGVVFDRGAERLHLVDEQAQEIPLDRALLLFLQLLGSDGRVGKLAFPVTVTSRVEELLEGSGLEIVRTPGLARRAHEDGLEGRVHLRGGRRRRVRLPRVPPGLRRRGEPGEAAGAPRAGRAAAVGARGLAAGVLARPRAAPLPVGAQGHGDARPPRAAGGPGGRPDRRNQGLRRAGHGPGAPRPRRARRPPLRGGAQRGGIARAGRGAQDDRRGDSRRRGISGRRMN